MDATSTLIKEHPFSIAMLTSPSRWTSLVHAKSTSAAVVTSMVDQTGGELSVSTTSTESLASTGQKSPMSTGSADCSPDSSFSSSSQADFNAAQVGRMTPGSLSPTSSEDSGRGSPTMPVLPGVGNLPRSSTPSSSSGNEKPTHSYIALISMVILESVEKKLVLSDIYQCIMDRFPFFDNQERAWRNSIRHNLSLNECFIKAGRAENGKGNYWAIHPACIDDFSKGDYRRRQARRRARATAAAEQAATLSFHCNMGYVPMTSSSVGSFNPCMHPAAMGFPYLQPPGLLMPASGLSLPVFHGTLPPRSLPAMTSQTSEDLQAVPNQYSVMMAPHPTTPYPGMTGPHSSFIGSAPSPTAGPSSMPPGTPYMAVHHRQSTVRYSPYGRYNTHQMW